MLQESQLQSSVYLCTFECTVREASISMKFPCSYFVEWTTTNGKSLGTTSKYKPEQNRVQFNQTVKLTTEMIFNNKSTEYTKKETLVELYLVSKSRPDQNKLVGRVTIDLAKIINVDMYAQPTQFKLQFCSVQGSLTMQFNLIDQKLTSKKVQDLDRSSFIDYIFYVSLKQQQKSIPNLKAEKQEIAERQNNKPSPNRTSLEDYVRKGITVKKSNLPQKNGEPRKTSMDQRNQEYQLGQHERAQKEVRDLLHKKITFGANVQRLASSYTAPQVLKAEQSEATTLLTGLPDRLESNIVKKANKNQGSQIVLSLKEEYQSKISKVSSQYNQDIVEKNVLIKKISSQLQDKDNYCKQLQEALQALKLQQQSVSKGQKGEEQQILKRLASYQGEIKELNQSLIEYENRIALYEQKFMTFEEMIRGLEQSNEKYHFQLATEQEQKQEFLQQINKLKKQGSLQQSQKRENKSLSNEELQGLKAKLEDRNELIQLMEGRIEDLQNKNQGLQSKIQELQDKNKEIETQFNQFIKQYDKKREAFDLLEAENQQLLLKIQNINSYNAGDAEQIKIESASEINIDNIEEEVNKAVIDILIHSVHSISSQEEIQQTVDIVVHSVHSISSEEQKIKQEAKQNEQGTIKALQQEVSKLNDQIQFLKVTLEMHKKETQEEIQTLKQDKYKLEQELQQMSTKHAQFELHARDESIANEKKYLQELQQYRQQISSINQRIEAYSDLLNEEKMKNNILLEEKVRLEEEKSNFDQHLLTLQNQNGQLLQKIKELSSSTGNPLQTNNDSNWQDRHQEYRMRIDRLNANLEEQINQNNQLSQTIIKYMEKQAKMKQTLTILEEQSKQIFVLFQEKEHNEETYQKMIQDLQREITRHRQHVNEIQSQGPSPLSPLKSLGTSKISAFVSPDKKTENLIQLQSVNNELNEEIYQLKNRYSDLQLQYESLLTEKVKKEEELEQLKTQLKVAQAPRYQNTHMDRNTEEADLIRKQLSDLQEQMEMIQEEKFGLQSDINEKDIRIMELQQQTKDLTALIRQMQSTEKQGELPKLKLEQMFNSFVYIRDSLLSNSVNADWQNLLKNVLDRSILGEETQKLMDVEQKSRLLSKQLQRLKAQLLKSSSRNQQERLSFMKLIKGCEDIITELISTVESLNMNQSSFL